MLNLLAVAVMSYLFVKINIRYAHSLDLIDIPNDRSHHCSIIPSGAGMGFVGAIFIGIGLFEFELLLTYWYIFLAVAMVYAIGIIDDKYEVSARWKFIVIFLAVYLIWLNGLSINTLGSWFGYEISLAPIVALFFTMFALAGFTNALNLIDGIDGLSSSISIIILSFFAFIGFEHHNHLMTLLSLFSIASLFGFLVLNWNPAKIFMGDSGSLSLGFIISILAVLSLEYIHPITILYLAAVPILDTLVVMIRRIRRGKSPFQADKTHIHHILVKFFGMNVQKTVMFFVIMQIIFSAIGYILIDTINQENDQIAALLALVGFALVFVLFYMIFTGIQKQQTLRD